MAWTDELIEEAKALNAEGLSAAEIAAAIGHGFSRNAVIGKLHRLGLTLGGHGLQLKPEDKEEREIRRRARRQQTGRQGGYARAALFKPRPKPEIPPAPENDADIPLEQRRTLLGLESDQCKWPVGTPGSSDFFFCGATQERGLPYCKTHCIRAYRAPGRQSDEDREASHAARLRHLAAREAA